ncbi:MAG: hypothetical protein ACYS8W_04605 [Planctomycetota bacterium]|jgi:hypothetical protein
MKKACRFFTLLALIAATALVIYGCGSKDGGDSIVLPTGTGTGTGTYPPQPPMQAAAPTPADGSGSVPVTQLLSWGGADGATEYDVYFGTKDDPPLIMPNNTVAFFSPGALEYETVYYWRIDASNSYGTTQGITWTFTTETAPTGVPAKAANVAPVNMEQGVSVDTMLEWSAAAGAASYDVYLGVNPTPYPGDFRGNITATIHNPPRLLYDTIYYWRIDSINSFGTTTGDIWSFRTELLSAPEAPHSPEPADGAANVSLSPTLRWTAGTRTDYYDVYFDTCNPPENLCATAYINTSFGPGVLANNTVYYWKIVAHNQAGETSGGVWSFTACVTGTNTVSTELVDVYSTDGPASGIFVLDNLAYVTSCDVGNSTAVLEIVDVSDPADMTRKGFLTFQHFASSGNICVKGSYAYIAAGNPGDGGLKVVDVSDPENPSIATTVSGAHFYSLTIVGDYLYAAAFRQGLRVIDISNPQCASEVGFVPSPNPDAVSAFDVWCDGSYAYVVQWSESSINGLQVIDVSTPTDPQNVALLTTTYTYSIGGEGACVFLGQGTTLQAIDVSSPLSPSPLGICDMPSFVNDTMVVDGFAYTACGDGHGLQIIDVADPGNPVKAGEYSAVGAATNVFVKGSCAYLTDAAGGLIVIKLEF